MCYPDTSKMNHTLTSHLTTCSVDGILKNILDDKHVLLPITEYLEQLLYKPWNHLIIGGNSNGYFYKLETPLIKCFF